MSPAGSRPRARKGHGEQLHGEILDAADRILVDTQSIEAVSIRAVADAVGVTPPSIYRHFPDKTHLLFEVCTRSFSQLNDIINAIPIGDDPLDTLLRQAEAYVRFGVEHPEHYRVTFMDRTGFTPGQYLEEMLGEGTAFQRLIQTVEALAATGRIRPALLVDGPLGLSLQFWAQVHGLTSLLIAKAAAPWPPLDRLIATQAELLVGGILATDPADPVS